MSSIKLDLKQFKHVKSDDKSTTLRHKDGHELTVAHAPLNKVAKEQLSALSKISDEAKTSTQKREDKAENKSKTVEASRVDTGYGKVIMKADGGKVAHYANPTDMVSQEDVQDEQPKAPESEAIEPKSKTASAMDLFSTKQAPITSTPAPVEDVALREPAQTPKLDVETEVNPNAAKFAELKKLYPGQSDEAVLRTIQLDDRRAAEAQQAKEQEVAATAEKEATKTADEQQRLANVAQQKQQMGIPLSEQEQAAVAPQQPDISQGVQQEVQSGQPQPQLGQNQAQLGQQPQQPSGPPGFGDYQGMLQSGYNQAMAGVQGTAAAQAQLGQQQSKALEQQVQAEHTAKAAFDTKLNELNDERKNLISDINEGHINPEQYWTGDKNGNGSHSRIMTGIGMILAGFNPTNSPNAAINFLKYQMDQNIEAQKQNLASKQNLLAANLRQFGNLKDATEMTRLMQSDVVHNKLLQAAATAQTPMAKAAALTAAAQIQKDYAPLAMQIGMRQAMMNLANQGAQSGDPSDTSKISQLISMRRAMGDLEGAKDLESHFIPGIGSNIHTGGPAIPEGARKELISMQQLQNSGVDLLEYSKKHTNLVPGTPDYNFGVTKAMTFQQVIREGLLGTVFRESEKPLLEKFVNENPAGAFKAFTTQPKLKAILESNMRNMNTTKQMYGLPQSKMAVEPIVRLDRATGKQALFDPETKKFLGYKE